MHYREVASAKAGTEEPEHEESRLSALCWLPLFSSFFFFAPSRLRVKNIGSTRLTDEPENKGYQTLFIKYLSQPIQFHYNLIFPCYSVILEPLSGSNGGGKSSL